MLTAVPLTGKAMFRWMVLPQGQLLLVRPVAGVTGIPFTLIFQSLQEITSSG